MEVTAVTTLHQQHAFYSIMPSMPNFDVHGELSSQNSQKREGVNNFQSEVGQDDDHASMRKLVNKLGGTYTSGKPLSLGTRRQIVAMAEIGMKACDISRQLQISHGCVSKIIAKWRSTGSFEPRQIGGSRPKKTIGHVVAAVRMYKRSCPSIRSLEIRHRLLADGVCTEFNVPSLSSINRIIRMKLRDDLEEFEASAVRDLMAILATAASPGAPSNGCTAVAPVQPNSDRDFQRIPNTTAFDNSQEIHDPSQTATAVHLPECAQQDGRTKCCTAQYHTSLQYQPPVQSYSSVAIGAEENNFDQVSTITPIRRDSSTNSSTSSSVNDNFFGESWNFETSSSENGEISGLYFDPYSNSNDMLPMNFDNDLLLPW